MWPISYSIARWLHFFHQPNFGQVGIMCTHWVMSCWLFFFKSFLTHSLYYCLQYAVFHLYFECYLGLKVCTCFVSFYLSMNFSTNNICKDHMGSPPLTSHTQHCSLSLSLSLSLLQGTPLFWMLLRIESLYMFCGLLPLSLIFATNICIVWWKKICISKSFNISHLISLIREIRKDVTIVLSYHW